MSGFFENTCISNIYMCIGNISILHTVSPEVNNVLLTSSFKKIKISLLDNVQCMIEIPDTDRMSSTHFHLFRCLCTLILNNILHVLLFVHCYSRKYLGNLHREQMVLSANGSNKC